MTFYSASGKLPPGRLVYRHQDFSLDTVGGLAGEGKTVVVNELQIEFADGGIARSLWGLCPKPSWAPAYLEAPRELETALLCIRREMVAGVSLSMNTDGERWPASFDEQSGWLLVGKKGEKCDTYIRFLTDCVAGLHNGALRVLWLRPQIERYVG
jgi:hypothetical protein